MYNECEFTSSAPEPAAVSPVELQLPNCDGLRKGTIRATARTQSSIAVSGDTENWVLFASPDVLQQVQRFPPSSRPAGRDTAIRAIVLIDAQIDHTTGLYMLREHRQPHSFVVHPGPRRPDHRQSAVQGP